MDRPLPSSSSRQTCGANRETPGKPSIGCPSRASNIRSSSGTDAADPFFFGQIFLDQEFAPVRGLDVATVIDLGGNIGLASIWFLNVFPRARIVTIEANPDNYPSLEANLHPYGDRATVVKGGVWWRRTALALVRRQNEGDAHVREAVSGDNPADLMEGWDIPAH